MLISTGRVPSWTKLLTLVSKFKETGTVLDIKNRASITMCIPKNVERVREAFQHSHVPAVSHFGHEKKQNLGFMIKIRFHLYKIQTAQQLLHRDKEEWFESTAKLSLIWKEP